MTDLETKFTADDFYVVHSIYGCNRCKECSLVYALLLSSANSTPVMVRNVEEISREACVLVSSEYPRYKLAWLEKSTKPAYINHCEKCGARLGDHFLHDPHDSPFRVRDSCDASNLVIRHFPRHIEVAGQRSDASGSLVLKHARKIQQRARIACFSLRLSKPRLNCLSAPQQIS